MVVIQDTDLEFDPENFQALMDPIDRDKEDGVYGSRFLEASPSSVVLALRRR